MKEMALRIAVMLIGYAFGLIQTAFIYGKLHGIDIRTQGSGNAGTTNALRTLGLKAGAIVMIGDLLKCILAILFVRLVFVRMNPELDYLLRAYTGFGCILGHNYPFYMGFRGGKGVACTSGYIMSFSAVMTAIGLVLFFGTVALTHYVSLASLFVGALLMTGTLIMGQTGQFHLTSLQLAEIYILTAVIVAEMVWRHRQNVLRLIRGTERKTYIFHKNREGDKR